MTFVVSPDCGIVLKAGNRHVQPLKRGGADNSSNVQWQTIEAAKIKIFARVLPKPMLQVQGPTPPSGSERCQQARGEHGIAVSTCSDALGAGYWLVW